MLKTKSIILNSYTYNEYDKILTILSDKKGIIKIYALGVNKISSKNKFSLQTFSLSYLEIFYSNKKGISKLKRGLIDKTNLFLALNYDLYLFWNYITDIVEVIISSHVRNDFIYYLIHDFLLLANDENWLILTTYIIFKLIDFAGIKFNLDSCCYCNSNKNIVTFCFKMTSFICVNCFKFCNNKINLNFLKILYNWKKINNLKKVLEYSTSECDEKNLNLLLYFLINYWKDELGVVSCSMYEIFKTNFYQNIKNKIEKKYKGWKHEL